MFKSLRIYNSKFIARRGLRQALNSQGCCPPGLVIIIIIIIHHHFDSFHPYSFSTYNFHTCDPAVYTVSYRRRWCGVGPVGILYGLSAQTQNREIFLSTEGTSQLYCGLALPFTFLFEFLP